MRQEHNDSIAIAILRRGQRHSLLGRRGHSQAQHPMAALQDRPRLTRAHLVQHEHLRKHLLRRRRERQGKRTRFSIIFYQVTQSILFYSIQIDVSEVVECATQSNIHNKIETLPDVSIIKYTSNRKTNK